MEKARDAAKSTGDTVYQRALDQRDQVIVQLADHDQQMLDLKNQDAQDAASGRVFRAANWDGFRKAILAQIGAGIQSGASLMQDANSDARGFWSYFLDPEFWRGEGGDLYWHYLFHPSELDTDLWVLNNVAYGMIGTGIGGLAGLGTGVGIVAIGKLAGSGTTATALAGLLGGGLVGGKVGGAIGGIGGRLGGALGSFGGNFAGGWLGWGAAGGPTFAMARVRGPHYFYSVTEGGTTTWSHWWGYNTTRGVEYFAARAGYWNTIRGIPIFFPKAALGTAGGSNCFTTCLWALWSGWTGL